MIEADLQYMNDTLEANTFNRINTLQYVITVQSKQELNIKQPKQNYIKQYLSQGILPNEYLFYNAVINMQSPEDDLLIESNDTNEAISNQLTLRKKVFSQRKQEKTEYSNNTILKSAKLTKTNSSKRVTFEYPESVHSALKQKQIIF